MCTVSDSNFWLVIVRYNTHKMAHPKQSVLAFFLWVGRLVEEEVGGGRGKERTSAYVYSHLKQIYLQSLTLFLCL